MAGKMKVSYKSRGLFSSSRTKFPALSLDGSDSRANVFGGYGPSYARAMTSCHGTGKMSTYVVSVSFEDLPKYPD